MNSLWAIPAVVGSLGAVGVYALARAAADEARQLGREIGRFGELRPALVAVRDELAVTRESLEARGRR
jgi:hypothetical protein